MDVNLLADQVAWGLTFWELVIGAVVVAGVAFICLRLLGKA